MKITDLAQHLHQLRHNRSGRAIGNAMFVSEVWACVLASDQTSIDRIDVHIEHLPKPVDGMFARIVPPTDTGDTSEKEIGAVFVSDQLEPHWRDSIVIKEMMHCFTPMERYSSTPGDAKALLSSLVSRGGRYTLNVAADDAGILAAAEVILPHKTIEALQSAGQDLDQIAVRHGLHPDIVREICRIDVMYFRKNGTITGA